MLIPTVSYLLIMPCLKMKHKDSASLVLCWWLGLVLQIRPKKLEWQVVTKGPSNRPTNIECFKVACTGQKAESLHAGHFDLNGFVDNVVSNGRVGWSWYNCRDGRVNHSITPKRIIVGPTQSPQSQEILIFFYQPFYARTSDCKRGCVCASVRQYEQPSIRWYQLFLDDYDHICGHIYMTTDPHATR